MNPTTANHDLYAKAQGLIKDSLVIDTMAGGPPLYTDRTLARIEDLLASGKSAIETAVLIAGDLIPELAQDAALRERYRTLWQASGVTFSSLTLGGLGSPPFSYESALASIAETTWLMDTCSDWLAKATTADDMRRAHLAGKQGLIWNFQNTTHFNLDMDHLDLFYQLGVRIIQLTYNTRNFVGDGCTERTDVGLSNFGVGLVRRLNRMGVLVDLSHCGKATAWDALRVSEKPVAFTHTCCSAVSPHDRAMPDDLLKAVASTGGYIGIVTVPFFVTTSDEPALAHVIEHVKHAVDVAGIDHVGIGTDWGAAMPRVLADRLNEEMGAIGFRPEHRVDWNADMPDYRSWLDWPNIVLRLLESGFSDQEVRKIVGLNFLRVFEETVG